MPGTKTEPSVPVWICRDCLILLANGDTDPELSEAETADYLARVDHGTGDAEITLGMLTSEHACAEDTGERAEECDCEDREFSWSPCDLCGSNLGGSRHAATFWTQPA